MNNLLFDFTIDKAQKTVFVDREFAAGISLVWDAFTKVEILDQWWAPKPWVSKTKAMDFKVGGRRLYAMVSPEGQEHWSVQDYTEINPTTYFSYRAIFTDQDGNVAAGWKGSHWKHHFSEQDGTTKVSIVIRHEDLESMERMLAMGFEGGFTMTLNYLDQLLQSL